MGVFVGVNSGVKVTVGVDVFVGEGVLVSVSGNVNIVDMVGFCCSALFISIGKIEFLIAVV